MERNPDSDPINFFKREPTEDALLKVRDRGIREDAAKERARIHEKLEQDAGRLRVKLAHSRQHWEQRLNRMSPKNPIRIAGEFVYRHLQTSRHIALGRMLEKSGREISKIVDQAIAADRAIQSQRKQSQRAQPIHQEKLKNLPEQPTRQNDQQRSLGRSREEQRAEPKDRQRGIDSGREEQHAGEGRRRNTDRGRGR